MASRIIIEKRLAFREAALEKLYDAYTALVDGGVKSYMIDDRQLTRFDLPALSEEIKQMENEIDQLTSELNDTQYKTLFVEQALKAVGASRQSLGRATLANSGSWYLPYSEDELSKNPLLEQSDYYQSISN